MGRGYEMGARAPGKRGRTMTIDQRIPADRLRELLAAGLSVTWPPPWRGN